MRPLALLAALVGAAVIPGAPPGIGVGIVALLIAATALTTARRSGDLLVFGAPALALAAFPVLLDARWVVTVDLVGAWLFASLAIGGPRLAALLAPAAALPSVPGLAPAPSARALPAVRGTVIASAVAVPFAALFLTADAAFAAVASTVPHPVPDFLPARLVTFGFVLVAAASLALAAKQPMHLPFTLRGPRLSFWEWALPLAVLDALFLAFVSVQAAVLFGGRDYVLETAGLTYAEYARQGFWQLIAAAALTLVVVKATAVVARPETSREHIVLRVALGILCALTVVILVSALHRLMLYEDAFGLTRARLAAEAFAVWLGGTFAVLLLLGAIRRTRQLPRVVVAWTALALVAFSAADPDARIAERNVARWRDTGRIDLDYLSTLSADATTVLVRLPLPLRTRALASIADRLGKDEPLTSANVSRARARRQLRAVPVSAATPGLP